MIFQAFTLSDIEKAKGNMCFTSTLTIWWASDWKHLQKGPIPLDIFGAPLFQYEDTDQFFDREKILKNEAYGRFPLTSYAMSHHLNLTWIMNTMGEHIVKDKTHKMWTQFCGGFSDWIENMIAKGHIQSQEAM